MATAAPTRSVGACPCWLRAGARRILHHELRTPITLIARALQRRGPQPPALQLIQQEAERMGTLVSDLLDLARNDSGRLQQCLTALVDNALLYTDGPVILAASSGPCGELVLHVIDRGPGVLPSEREAIFGRIVGGSAGLASPHRGSGIGLSVVRLLIEAVGGRVQVAAHPGDGADVQVLLLGGG